MIYNSDYGYKVQLKIETIDGSKHVTVLAPFYKRKEWDISFSWSTQFSDYEILKDRDLVTYLISAFGVN